MAALNYSKILLIYIVTLVLAAKMIEIMKNKKDEQQQKNAIISNIYDVVLNPDHAQSFFEEWEKYITAKAEKFNELDIPEIDSAYTIHDDELESHFARAYAVLEKINAEDSHSSLTDLEEKQEVLFSFDASGDLIEHNLDGTSELKTVKFAEELAQNLDRESAAKWKQFVKNSRRAPELNRLHIFSLQEYGNLIAFNHRDEATGKFQLIIKQLRIQWTNNLKNLLQNQFVLTNRELELLQGLSELGTLDHLVRRSNRSKNTLRTQIKSIFRKMNVRSQTEVMQSVALLAHFCDVLGYTEITKNVSFVIGDIQTFKLSKNVEVPVHFIGPEDGRPILFIHGMFDGVTVNKPVLEALERYNLRLVSPIRPNFGLGPAEENIKNIPAIVSEQFVELVEKIDLEKVVLMGHMSGSIFSFRAAKDLGKKAIGIVNVSGGVPILSTKQNAKQSMRQKAFFYTARFTPAIFPTLMRAAMAQLDSSGPYKVMLDMYAEGTKDREVIKDTDIAEVVADGYRFTIAQGYKGFEADAYQVVRNWSEFVKGTTQPVLLIHGAHDHVVSIEAVEQFAQRENFGLETLPDDGQLILYSRPDIVFSKIAEFYDKLAQTPQMD